MREFIITDTKIPSSIVREIEELGIELIVAEAKLL